MKTHLLLILALGALGPLALPAAETNILAVPNRTTAASTDLLPIYQISGSTSTVNHVTYANLLGPSLTAVINNTGTLNLSGITLTLPADVTRLGSTITLTSEVDGILPKANGGTGTATPSLVQGANITITGTWPNQTIAASVSGSGDVVGPASATDGRMALFDGVTGKLLKVGAAPFDPANITDDLIFSTDGGKSIGTVNHRVMNVLATNTIKADSVIWGGSYLKVGNSGGNSYCHISAPADGVLLFRDSSDSGGVILTLVNVSSLGSVTGGARIGAISGEMNVLDASGNVTVISPHTKWAPPDLYETGNDRMDREVNLFTGRVLWYNTTRRRIIDRLDMLSRLGTAGQSAAAWAEVFQRQQEGRFLCEREESIAECELRTGESLWTGETPEARAAFAALTPAQRWASVQQAEVAKSVAARTAWSSRGAAAVEKNEDFTELEPAIYTAQPAPAFLQP